MNIREQFEQLEIKQLSKFACYSLKSKGRLISEGKCKIRTEFQRDKDRIIYSKAFRRLKHKTQVFISPEGDHYITRLTHTLEVSQVARTIARALKLNEDLTEAISLGHDLGHTPFGHVGEQALNEACPQGFKHNEQSLRVVDILEKRQGLNLTWEVRDGILNHNGTNKPSTLEGQIVKFADRIAYINHDIEDAIRGKVIKEIDLPKDCIDILGFKTSTRINNMIENIIENSQDIDCIKMSNDFLESTNKLRKFMFDNVYEGIKANDNIEKAKKLVKNLYNKILKNPELLNNDSKEMLDRYNLDRIVCDYVAGMTDRYAISKFNEIYLPYPWNIK